MNKVSANTLASGLMAAELVLALTCMAIIKCAFTPDQPILTTSLGVSGDSTATPAAWWLFKLGTNGFCGPQSATFYLGVNTAIAYLVLLDVFGPDGGPDPANNFRVTAKYSLAFFFLLLSSGGTFLANFTASELSLWRSISLATSLSVINALLHFLHFMLIGYM